MNVSLPLQRSAPPLRDIAAVVAIPVRNEAARIASCLEALAVQQAPRNLTVLLLLNGCTDGTEAILQAIAPRLPFRLVLERALLPPDRSHAGEARGRAMDAAAQLLESEGEADGILLTTDADSRVAPDWLAANRAALRDGADLVAGLVDYDPFEVAMLPPPLQRRIALEGEYDGLLARLEARLDPLPWDSWPRHRMASGASIALGLPLYRRIGGLPRLPVGEDRALVAAAAAADARIVHSCEVRVSTASRIEGRAAGGAADTLKARIAQPELLCDAKMEPVAMACRRWQARAALRRLHAAGDRVGAMCWAASLLLPVRFPVDWNSQPFGALWQTMEAASPLLCFSPLHPAELPAQAAQLRRMLDDESLSPVAADPAGSDRYDPAAPPAEPALSPP